MAVFGWRRVVGTAATVLSSMWLAADYFGRLGVVALALAEIKKPDAGERLLGVLASMPPLTPLAVLIAALVTLFVPDSAWRWLAHKQPSEPDSMQRGAALVRATAADLEPVLQSQGEQIKRLTRERDDAQLEAASFKRQLDATEKESGSSPKPAVPKASAVQPPVPVSSGAQEERILVDVTPELIVANFVGRTTVEGNMLVAKYVGKRMSVSGVFWDLKTYINDEWLVTFEFKAYPLVMMIFRPEWCGRIEVLERGTHIKVIGRVELIEYNLIRMQECELAS